MEWSSFPRQGGIIVERKEEKRKKEKRKEKNSERANPSDRPDNTPNLIDGTNRRALQRQKFVTHHMHSVSPSLASQHHSNQQRPT